VSISKKAFSALLTLAALLLLGHNLRRSYLVPPQALDSRLGEHLALAGEFSGPLPMGLEEHLKNLSLRLEKDPSKKAVLLGQTPAQPATLTPGYLLWYQYQSEGRDFQRHDLHRLGYTSLIRLLTVAFGFILALCALLVLPLIMKTRAAPGPTLPGPGLARCLGVLSSWYLGNGLIVWLAGSFFASTSSRFWLVMGVQTASYLLGLSLLVFFWKWGSWRPWKNLSWKWLWGGYGSVLILLPLTEASVFSLTGVDPRVQLSLLPYFQGLPTHQGALLCLLAVVIGPVFEELLFRGWLLGGLRTVFGKTPSLVVASLLFALVHQNFWGWPVSFVFGLISGVITLRTSSIATSIGVHALWNATTLGWVYLNL
jgi:membrane protease YdiL (CAAX protease family)